MATAITITGIMNTTPTKAAFPSWWVAGLALILIGLGTPMTAGRFLLLSGDDTRAALLDGRRVPQAELGAFEGGRLRVAAWFPVNTVFNDLTMATIERSLQTRPQERAVFLKDAEYWQRRALGITPADTYGWFRLAFLFLSQDGPSSRSAAAFAQSMASAPYEPRLLSARIQMAIKLGSFLDPDLQRRVPFMIRDAMRMDEEALARTAKAGGFAAVVERALADSPDDLERFRSNLKEVD